MAVRDPQEDRSFLGRIAMGVTALLIGGLFLAFQRFLAGSWQTVAAGLIAVTLYLGGAIVLDAWLRRSGRRLPGHPAPLWAGALVTLLGAVAGFAYGVTAVGQSVVASTLVGAAIAAVLAVVSLREQRAKDSDGSRAPAA